MNQSEQLNELAAALSAFQAAMQPVPKTATVKARSYNFTYAPLDEIIQATAPLLAQHGLSVTQIPEDGGLTTILMHKSGQYLAGTMPLPGKPGTAQDEGGRITYARRYAYSAMLGIVTEEDTDGPPAPAQPRRNGKKLKPSGVTNEQLREARDLLDTMKGLISSTAETKAYARVSEARTAEKAAEALVGIKMWKAQLEEEAAEALT